MAFDTVVDAQQLDGAMTATANAIRKKSGSEEQIIWDQNTGFKAAVDALQMSPAIASPPEEKEVNFFDYDGTLLYSFTLAEAWALTALPPLPEHDGLVCQGWNWTLEEVNAANRPALIGPNYDTVDGSTKLHIDTVVDKLSFVLNLTQSTANAVSVDWGDGSAPIIYDTSGDFSLGHVYNLGKRYVITLQSAEGALQIGSTTNIASSARVICSPDILREINLGRNVSEVRAYSFYSLRMIEKISFSAGVVFSTGYSTFDYSGRLQFMALPRAATSAGPYFLRYADSLFGVASPPNFSFTPSASFSDASRLRFAPIPPAQSAIGNYYLRNARCLSQVYVPASINTIDVNAFAGCSAVLIYDFTQHKSVPRLTNINAFTNISADCEIRVPSALYDDWVAATNWATYAANIVGV